MFARRMCFVGGETEPTLWQALDAPSVTNTVVLASTCSRCCRMLFVVLLLASSIPLVHVGFLREGIHEKRSRGSLHGQGADE